MRGLPKREGSYQPTAEILSIGNELLIGHTLDTNSNWIARHLNKLGWKLQRVTQLRDSLDAISIGLRESLARKPLILITLGGLGPTHDDMTMAGIALALRRPLKINKEALHLIRDHYRKLDSKPTLTKYRIKMATLPQGAEAVTNTVGTAPAVRMKYGGITIFSLPGVPSEMRAIFLDSMVPYLKSFGVKGPTEIQIRITGIIESALAPFLDKIRIEHPGLYFKSHPGGRETGVRPLITLQIYNVRPESSKEVPLAANKILRRLSTLKLG